MGTGKVLNGTTARLAKPLFVERATQGGLGNTGEEWTNNNRKTWTNKQDGKIDDIMVGLRIPVKMLPNVRFAWTDVQPVVESYCRHIRVFVDRSLDFHRQK